MRLSLLGETFGLGLKRNAHIKWQSIQWFLRCNNKKMLRGEMDRYHRRVPIMGKCSNKTGKERVPIQHKLFLDVAFKANITPHVSFSIPLL